jgi:hypothetical protein
MRRFTRRRKSRRGSRKQRGGAQTRLTVRGVEFQGADVFMINNYKGVDNVVLFQSRNAKGPYLQLAGGRCEDTHGSLEQTISEELYEESRKSIRISEDVFKKMTRAGSYVDYMGDKMGLSGMRRCFVCAVPYISTKIYNENKQIFDLLISSGNPAAVGKLPGYFATLLKKYLETDAMVRIPFKELTDAVRAGNDGRARDVKGHHIATYVMKAIVEARKKGCLPFDLRTVKHAETINNNEYKDLTQKLRGRIDEYTL